MKYGLIGEKLSHSFSRDIHKRLGNDDYVLKEIARDDVERFFASRDFLGINVTIPYKETVIPYLDYIDPAAEAIGAVNTVVNKNGTLFGYNTDASGMESLIRHAGIGAKGKKAAILGTGGTSKTARYVLGLMGAKRIVTVSRRKSGENISYEELSRLFCDTEIIINTTPVGMYPNTEGCPIDISAFPKLSGVIDAIYNPLRTKLVLDAMERGIPATGGLYMLVSQAKRASEIFFDKEYPSEFADLIYKELNSEKENIVLIGMPSSGKSTVGRSLSSLLNFGFSDTDELVKNNAGMEISEIFEKYGEEIFRDKESEAVFAISKSQGCVIATGGGSVLRKKNVDELKKNGKIIFIDRSPDKLIPTSDRPLSSDREKIKKRYDERYGIYCDSADIKINGDGTVDDTVRLILESLKL